MEEVGVTKASTLPVMFCLGLLFLPASGLDRNSDSRAFSPGGGGVVCVCAVRECVFLTTSCCFYCLTPIVFFAPVLHFLSLFLLQQACNGVVYKSIVHYFQIHSQGSRDGQVLLRRTAGLLSDLPTCLFQDSTHGFLLISFTFLLCHVSFVIILV